MTLGLNNDSLQLRTRIKSSLSLSTFTLTLFRVTATNIPISRLLSHRDIYFPSWRHRVFFSGFGAREYWKYSVSLPFALLFLSRSDTFRKPEYFSSLQRNSNDLFSFLAFLTFFHNFQGNTPNAHSPWFFSFSSSSHHRRILFLADWELLAMTEVKFWKWKWKARLEWDFGTGFDFPAPFKEINRLLRNFNMSPEAKQ